MSDESKAKAEALARMIAKRAAYAESMRDAIVCECAPVLEKLYEALDAAREELRLLRMKDTAVVYDLTVRTKIAIALALFEQSDSTEVNP